MCRGEGAKQALGVFCLWQVLGSVQVSFSGVQHSTDMLELAFFAYWEAVLNSAAASGCRQDVGASGGGAAGVAVQKDSAFELRASFSCAVL